MFDKQSLDIPCPKCGKKTKKTVGWIKTHDTYACSGCGETITLNAEELITGLKSAEKALKKALSGFGKIR